jgi:hypothetical protein
MQVDGASSHIAGNDPEFVAAATEELRNLSLFTQSPKSPDLNVLHQWRNGFANNLDALIMRVEQAHKIEPRKLDFGYVSCNYGNNDYVIRHMDNEAMGTLPVSIVPSDRA